MTRQNQSLVQSGLMNSIDWIPVRWATTLEADLLPTFRPNLCRCHQTWWVLLLSVIEIKNILAALTLNPLCWMLCSLWIITGLSTNSCGRLSLGFKESNFQMAILVRIRVSSDSNGLNRTLCGSNLLFFKSFFLWGCLDSWDALNFLFEWKLKYDFVPKHK